MLHSRALTGLGVWGVLMDIGSRFALCGKQDFWRFNIWKLVLHCLDKFVPSADILSNVCCIIWLLQQYALYVAVLLILWCRFIIGYYIFSTPQYFIFHFELFFSLFFWITHFKFFQFGKSFFWCILLLNSNIMVFF